MGRKNLAILGSTGSIGRQTLEVVRMFPGFFNVSVLAAGSNVSLLEEQTREFKPLKIAMRDPASAKIMKSKLKDERICVYEGAEGILEALDGTKIDLLVNAISGVSGLLPTIEAINRRIPVALANKETLVAAGEIVMKKINKKKVTLIPVDSEHSAIFQCLENSRQAVDKIILTASGGPFRGFTRNMLKKVTPAEALQHPNWVMGNKITIDSATMFNKALEVIEAYWLFGIDYDRIDVLIHPESIVHSMVAYQDRAVLAQMGKPDMRIPIQYALTWPERWKNSLEPLELDMVSKLTFERPDLENFRALTLGYLAGKKGGSAPAIMNAANEVAVDLFLKGKISFLQITDLVEYALEAHRVIQSPSLEDILETDRSVRDWLLSNYNRYLLGKGVIN